MRRHAAALPAMISAMACVAAYATLLLSRHSHAIDIDAAAFLR